MSKYVIAYVERDRQDKPKFVYGGAVLKKEYKKIIENGFFFNETINEDVRVKKVKLLEVIEEDEISC